MAKLRKLRVVLAAAAAGRIAGAARALNMSQPAATRAIQSLEAELGATLFYRTSQGLPPTDVGAALIRRLRRAFSHLESAEADLPAAAGARGQPAFPLSRQAADHEFHSLIAVARWGTVTAAARSSALSQPALNRSLKALERRLATPLFHRTSLGMRPTAAGETLLRRVSLALNEIRQGLEEVAALEGATGGRLRIGALPLTRVRLVPAAVETLLAGFRDADLGIVDGTYDALMGELRRGDLDVIVGTIRDPLPNDDLVAEELFRDDVVAVVGAGRPLAGRRRCALSDCLDCAWVLPFKAVPLRNSFERSLAEAGLPGPQRVIETNSVVLVRSLLVAGERIAIVSRHQVELELELGMLKILPIPFDNTDRPVGLTLRRDYEPTPLARAFFEAVRIAGRDVATVLRREAEPA